MSDEEIAPSANAATDATDAAAAADADDTTLATTAVNSEGDDFATHVEKLIHSKKTETPSLLLDLRASLATPSDRLEGAEKMKLEANASLSRISGPLTTLTISNHCRPACDPQVC